MRALAFIAALADRTWLAASAQGLGPFAGSIEGTQQRIHLNPERPRQAVHHVDARVHRAVLDAAEVGRSYARIDGKRLLRQSPRGAELPDIPREARPSIHERQARC